jgi:hypothetical protein
MTNVMKGAMFTMTTGLRCGERLAARRRGTRQRHARWDMAWWTPSFASLVWDAICTGTVAGGIAGTPVFPVFGTLIGAVAGLLGSIIVAPVVALVLRRDDGRAVGIALAHAQHAAVLTTALVFAVLLPWQLGTLERLDTPYLLFVIATVVAAWWATRVLVVRAVRRSRREPSR